MPLPNRDPSSFNTPATDLIPVPANIPAGGWAVPGGMARGILCGENAGTINITTSDGNDRDDVPIQSAQVLTVFITKIRAATATNLWVMI